jgi:hypothetical protein
VWPKANNVTAFALYLKSTHEGEHMIFGLMSLANPKVLIMYWIYHTFIHLPATLFFFTPPPPIPGKVSAGTIVAFTYMCTHYLHWVLTLFPFPTTSSLPLVPTSHSALLFSNFVEEKRLKIKRKTCFCYFEIRVATQGVSLCYVRAHMYYNPNWFISSIPLHSSLVPFLWWSQPV